MIEKLIQRIARALDHDKIPYIIVGGQAVLRYGTPRLTRDIDITLGIDTGEYDKMVRVCKRLKLRILSKDPARFARDTKVLPVEETNLKIRVDFIFSFTAEETPGLPVVSGAVPARGSKPRAGFSQSRAKRGAGGGLDGRPLAPYERQAMHRARRVALDRYLVKFASPEDVIIHKMIAGRAVDLEDIKNILTKSGRKLNTRYIRKWLSAFGQIPELKGILERFKDVRKATH